MRSRAGFCVVVSAVVAGCGGGGRSASTGITVTAVNPSVGLAVFHLSCQPDGGDVPDPAGACARLAAAPDLVTRPRPFTCHGGTSSWWDITISGRLAGRAFTSQISTCWTPQMRLIDALGIGPVLEAHLLPRRTEALTGGQTRLFASGRMRPGDLIACTAGGVRIQAGVPVGVGGPTESGHVNRGRRVAWLTVTRQLGGSVSARCEV